MTAQETLDIIAKPWCNLEDLMKLAQVGRNLALELRHKIRAKWGSWWHALILIFFLEEK